MIITITALVELSVNLNMFCNSAFLISKVTLSIVDIALVCHFTCLKLILKLIYPIFVGMSVKQNTTKIRVLAVQIAYF